MLLSFLNAYVEEPLFVILILPVIIILFFVIMKDFGRKEQKERSDKRIKKFVFVLRLLAFSLLLIALASPYALYQKMNFGEPSVVFLVDNSSSYDIFQRGKSDYIYDELKKTLDIEIRQFGDMQKSAVGDEIIGSLKKGKSVLLMSDGQVTEGNSLGDAALQAQKINATINVIMMDPLEKDYAVVVDGPSKISSGVETEYTVEVIGNPSKEHVVRITIDGKESFERKVEDKTTFTKTFAQGYHTIQADLIESDFFRQNNVYYKSVKVIDTPKAAMMSLEESPLSELLNKVYAVETASSLGDVADDYAVILNDIPSKLVEDNVDELQKFVSDGNGLVVFGGLNSFERGEYKNSALEKLLPVTIGSVEKQGGGTSVVILIDISQSFAIDTSTKKIALSGQRYAEDDTGVSKALAISIIEGIKQDDYLGVIAFDTKSYAISDIEVLFEKNLGALLDKIASLQPAIAGQTLGTAAIPEALQMLLKGPGGKNIILISDGQIQKKDQFLAAAQNAASQGVTIYTVGVGEQTNEALMQQAADITGGGYFPATQKNKVKILFGQGKDGKSQDGYTVILKDRNHYITKSLKINAQVYGFNEAIPKPSAQLLATTDQGDPLIVAWRYGLGRVVAVLTDDGKLYAGELLSKDNSKLLLRALSWAAGDPERKGKTFLTINDGRIGEKIEALYKGDPPPEGMASFSKVDENTYRTYLDSKDAGFHTFWQATYAVNNPKEYETVGLNDELKDIAASTNGRVFDGKNIGEIASELQKQSKQTALDKWQYQRPFVLMALIIFLIEVCVRRIIYFRR